MEPDLAVVTAIIFLMLVGVLWKFAWGPLAEGLRMREESIANQIDKARQSAEQAKHSLEQAEAQMAAVEEKVSQLVAEAGRDAETTKQRILSEAQEMAQKERDRALNEIEAAKNAALAELAQTSVETSVVLAEHIIREEITAEDHSRLIKDSLVRLPSRN